MGIVIDACVLRSASLSDKPLPGACRLILEEVTGSSVRVLVCDALLAEWRRHRSIYAQKWISSMYSRRLLVKLTVFSGRSTAVENAVARLDERHKVNAEKDLHLLKLALDGDRVVVSSEKACREAFILAGGFFPEIQDVVWIEPLAGQQAIDVIRTRRGAPREWRLAVI